MMNYKEMCIQAELSSRELERANKTLGYEIVVFVGRDEWSELCGKFAEFGNEDVAKKHARFFNYPVRIMDTNSYFGLGFEIASDYF